MNGRAVLTAFLVCLSFNFSDPRLGEKTKVNVGAAVQEETQTQSPEINFRLENGLQVYFLPTSRYVLGSVVLGLKAGSNFEAEESNGLAHLLEHCLLFRQNYPSGESRWQKFNQLGLYLNAHTELETMLFETCFPPELLEPALNLLGQVVFDFQLSEKDLEKEKQVVLKELRGIARDPQKTGLAAIYSLAFPSTSYGRPVFGQEAVIKSLPLSSLHNYHHRLFQADNASLVIIGPFEAENIKKMVSSIFSSLPRNSANEIKGIYTQPTEKISLLKESRQAELTMDITETYLMAGLLAPAYNDPEQPLMDVLVEILGYGINPLLYSAFSGRPDLVTSLKINYLLQAKAGLLVITVVTTKEKVFLVKRLLQDLFNHLSEFNYSSEDYPPGQQTGIIDFLTGAQNRIRLLAEASQENPLNLAMSLSRHLLLASDLNRIDYLQTVEKIRSSDLRKLAHRYFGQGKPVWVIINPEGK